MSRAPSTANDPSLTGLSGLTGFNRQPLTPEQQMQALKRVQAQAEQRVKLGMQLFKAAETRLSGQTDVLQQIKTLQKQLREQVNQDVAKSLHSYDQWIGQIDESFTTAIRKLEEKIDAVHANTVKSESRMNDMLQRAEAMLDQSRCLMEQNSLKTPIPNHPSLKPPAPPVPPAPLAPPATPLPTIASASPPKPLPPVASMPPANPLPPITPTPPKQNLQAELNTKAGFNEEPPTSESDDEKIYSKLLQRLIDENPGASAHGPESNGEVPRFSDSDIEDNDSPAESNDPLAEGNDPPQDTADEQADAA